MPDYGRAEVLSLAFQIQYNNNNSHFTVGTPVKNRRTQLEQFYGLHASADGNESILLDTVS